MKKPPTEPSLLSEDDLYLFNEGTHTRLQQKMGAHPIVVDGTPGTMFSVWAPNAEAIHVSGDFNGWSKDSHPLRPREKSGIWEGFIPGVGKGTRYKYHLASRYAMYRADKADPFALFSEVPPQTASVVWDFDYTWGDDAWMAERYRFNGLGSPM